MSQHDYDIANAAGAGIRSDINSALAAIVSQNSGATAPATTFAYQFWADTTTGWLKQRNAANSAWLYVSPLAGHAEADVASATTTDIGASTSDLVRITGTTTITGLGTADAGRVVKVRHAGALTLTHNATSLILPGAANITTAAGDTYEAVSLGSGNWTVRAYQKASGLAVVVAAATSSFNDLIFGGELNTSDSAVAFTRYGLYQSFGLGDGRNTDGTFTFAGGGAANGLWALREKSGGTYLTPFLASKNPTIEVIAAQFGTGAGTRYFGLMNSAASPGTDGIYFRHTNGGNIIAVARASGSESTVDTGVAASSTARKCKMVVTGGASIDVQIDGVSKGTLSTNIPSAALGVYIDGGSTATTDGIKASFFKVQQSR